MRNPEEAIDKVLAGLHEVETPTGMEWRILQQLEVRAALRSRSTRWRMRLLPVGAAGALACGAIVSVALHSGHKAAPIAPAVGRAAPPPEIVRVTSAFTPERQHRVLTTHRTGASVKTPAAAELGFPAPPLPLTAEEKLLLRVAQGGAPTAVVLLDPQALSEREAVAEKEFRERMEQAPETVSAASLQTKLKNLTLEEGAGR